MSGRRSKKILTFQEIIFILQRFWASQGCVILQPYDLETGAGTFHPATFLKVLGPDPWKAAFVQPCRRPTDGRYGENPNRLQHYYQFQVILKPAPDAAQELYRDSLVSLGIHPSHHDIRFVHDDWEAPTLGAWGLGWEVRLDGMEITQFTYFQEVGGFPLDPVSCEITYGLERIAMFLQQKESVFDLVWADGVTYGDIHHRDEVEFSRYNFEEAGVERLLEVFTLYENEATNLLGQSLLLPAYDYCIKTSHVFNLLDARRALSVTERVGYLARVRSLAYRCAEMYLHAQSEKGAHKR